MRNVNVNTALTDIILKILVWLSLSIHSCASQQTCYTSVPLRFICAALWNNSGPDVLSDTR